MGYSTEIKQILAIAAERFPRRGVIAMQSPQPGRVLDQPSIFGHGQPWPWRTSKMRCVDVAVLFTAAILRRSIGRS